MAILNSSIEKKLWDTACDLWVNAKLKPSEYATPVLGLIFLRYAEFRFDKAAEKIEKSHPNSRRQPGKADYQRLGALYVPDKARFSYILGLPEEENIQQAIIDAMKAIEQENEELKDVLPKLYSRVPKETLLSTMKLFNEFEFDEHGDIFGAVYEYFLGNFAMKEGQKGGEFFTPASLVRLIVEVIEPFQGKILDPACGSGGMFVHSARFVDNHKGNSANDISIYGQEKIADTVRLCKMNLAVHGLFGQIREANTYYENVHGCYHKMNYVMANPPFNASGIDKERIKGDKRYPFGLPTNDNANYIWIQEFFSAMQPGNGKAGFVMANSATDARGTELEIRKKIIQEKVVDVMISIGSNFFYTVTLPCTLWFFDNIKLHHDSEDTVLFIDARNIFTQIDRAHREFSRTQIEYIANIVRLYHNREIENREGGGDLLKENFPDSKYIDVPSLCKVATIDEIEVQGWSLNPGRYVGTIVENFDEEDFWETFSSLNSELQKLNAEAQDLEQVIEENFQVLVSANE